MHCLVTGGCGFIGSHLVRALVAAGHSVRVLDDLSTGNKSRLAGVPHDFLEGSICTPVTAGRAVAGVDWVFHLAAQASVVRSMESPLETHRANATGTVVLLEAARRAGVSRLVFSSTCAVYPESGAPLTETTIPAPASPYAASKLAAEAAVTVAARSLGLSATTLRFFNVYGPGQSATGAYAAVIPAFFAAFDAGKHPVIYGDGGQTRDFVFVGDAVAALIAAANNAESAGHILNVASGTSTSVTGLCALADRAANTLSAAAAPLHQPARPGEIRHSVADISLAKHLLHWAPRTSLADGLRQCWLARDASPASKA
jgi:UDP-glucose 4-epimerase